MNIADLHSEIRNLCDTDSTGYTDANILRRINAAYEQVVGKIIGLDGRWEFDDVNYTTFPVGTTTLVADQKDYSFDTTFLNILRVEILDAQGNYYLIDPIDKSQVGVALTEFMPDSGAPLYYDKDGDSIVLYPAPATGKVTMAAGLKVYFQRTADVFTSAQVTTGTKEPGFASPFHIVLAYMTALPYCATYKKDRVPWLQSKIDEILGNEDKGIQGLLPRFYSKRSKDERPTITLSQTGFR